MGGRRLREVLGLVAANLREGHAHRKLRQDFRAAIGLSAQPGLDDIVAAVGRHCGTPIDIVYLPMKHPFTGGLFHTPDRLLLIVDSVSPRLLQQCVIGHELAHVFLGHDPERHGHDILDEALLASLLPAINPTVARMMLGRTYYNGLETCHTGSSSREANPAAWSQPAAPPERQAETLGRIIVSLLASHTHGEDSALLNSALRHRGTGV